MNKLECFIRSREESQVSFGQWICGGLCIVLLRSVLETVMSGKEYPFIHPFYLVHFPLFFISLLLGIIVFLHLFTQTEITKVSKLAMVFFPIILFPPLLDLVTVLRTHKEIEYFYITSQVGLNFVNFFNPSFSIPDFVMSLRLEIALVTLGAFFYIFLKRKKIILSLIGAFCVFSICYFYVAIPGIFINLCVFVTPRLHRMVNFIGALFGFSRQGVLSVTEGMFVVQNLMSVELFVFVVTAFVWYRRYDKARWVTLIKNMRGTRSAHYMLLVLLGLLFYLLHNTVNDYFLFLKIFGILMSVFFAFQFSVVTNDAIDVACDKISNSSRPLVTGQIDKNEYLKVGFVYLAFALLFSLWVGDACFMLTLTFIVLYAVYSLPPFQLKKNFFTSSLIIGLEALTAFLMGQISLQAEGTMDFVYLPVWFLVFFIFFLASPIKDFKDVEGDRCMQVATLPVLLGLRRARILVGLFLFFSYGMIPFVLKAVPSLHFSLFLVPVSLLFGIVNFIYLLQPKAQEKNIFFLYFGYAFLLLCFVR